MKLVNQQITDLEKNGKNYVIEGYPRTRVQAIWLQRMGIIPDKFFILNIDEATISKKIRSSTQQAETPESGDHKEALNSEEIDAIVHNVILEYNMYFF